MGGTAPAELLCYPQQKRLKRVRSRLRDSAASTTTVPLTL
jgi:hypothetical protein